MRIFSIAALLISVSVALEHETTPVYSEAKAKLYLRASELGYCLEKQILPKFQCSTCKNLTVDGFEPLCASSRGKYDVTAVAIINQKTKEVIVSFSGTRTFSQLQEEMRVNKQIPYKLQKNVKGYVYGYFYDSYAKDVRPRLSKCLAKVPTGYDVTFTGHSLGGALASIAAMDSYYAGFLKTKPSVYTFGSPRWADKELGAYFIDAVKASYRVVYGEDVIAKMPEGYDYHHVPTEVWYNKDFKEYHLFTEDGDREPLDFMKAIVGDGYKDHVKYFGDNVGDMCYVGEKARNTALTTKLPKGMAKLDKLNIDLNI